MKFDRIYIEINNICNLQCDFCPEVERSKGRMSLELFRHVLGQVQGLTQEITLHVMGEPTNHPEFSLFVDECAAFQLPVTITTNGTLIGSQGIQEALLKPIVRQVNFSLQSVTAQGRMTEEQKKDVRDRYLARIFSFARRALIERPELYLNFRLWNLGTAAADEEENSFFLGPIENEFGFRLGTPVDVGFRKSKKITGRLYLHFDSRFEWPSLQGPIRQLNGFCYALKNHFAILTEGTVVPCCLDKEARISLGQIGPGIDANLREILVSDRAKKLRLGFDRGEICEALCQRCQYIERFGSKAQRIQSQSS